jgi:hypothetical protein
LIRIDAPAYDAVVSEQVRLLGEFGEVPTSVTNAGPLLALSQLITLNTRLLQNLLATTPIFESVSYTAAGRQPAVGTRSRMSVEA